MLKSLKELAEDDKFIAVFAAFQLVALEQQGKADPDTVRAMVGDLAKMAGIGEEGGSQ